MTFHYILWLDDKDFWLLNDSFSSRFWTVEWFATYLTKLILTLRTWTLTLPSILHYSLGHLPFYLFLLSLDSIHRWLPSCLVFRLNRWGVMSGWHNTYKKNGFYITIGIRRALCFVGASLPHNYRAYGTKSNFACNRFQALFIHRNSVSSKNYFTLLWPHTRFQNVLRLTHTHYCRCCRHRCFYSC